MNTPIILGSVVEPAGERVVAESMHAIEAASLHMDRPTNLMVVNTPNWTERPLDEQRLLEVLEDRLIRRFRRFSGGRPAAEKRSHRWAGVPPTDLRHYAANRAPSDV